MKHLLALVLLVAAAGPLFAQGHEGSCTCGGIATPRVAWQIEHGAQPQYAAPAKAMFDLWNQYIDVFDAGAGDGTARPNGVDEILFASIAEASASYGITMDRITFAITMIRPMAAAGDFDACPKPPQASCGTFDETDVIMNADFLHGWRPSGAIDYSDTAPALYAATAVHELGHALGFHHNVGNVSVMNLYEDFAAQYIATADTQEARRAYPSQARAVVDLAIYPFSFDARFTDYAATTPVEVLTPQVVEGGAVTVRNFGLENVGSEAVTDAVVRFYLSRDAEVTGDDVLLGSLTFNGTVAAGAFWDDAGEGRTFAVPRDLPIGSYFLGALVTYGSGATDSIAYNNRFVAAQQVKVYARPSRRRAVRP